MTSDTAQNDAYPRILVRIARILGVPVSAFFAEDRAYPLANAETGAHDADQGAMLLRLFLRLKSPEARERCFAYLRKEAAQDEGAQLSSMADDDGRSTDQAKS